MIPVSKVALIEGIHLSKYIIGYPDGRIVFIFANALNKRYEVKSSGY